MKKTTPSLTVYPGRPAQGINLRIACDDGQGEYSAASRQVDATLTSRVQVHTGHGMHRAQIFGHDHCFVVSQGPVDEQWRPYSSPGYQ